jgi:haloalkane dehalogenase
MRPFLASLDRVKGTDGASVSGASDETIGRMGRSSAEVIESHRAAGRRFDANGVGSFVREQGSGEPVVLLHGVPSSSFLYRKVLPLLAAEGLRAVAFDYPGLGLADRPQDFDYTWSGLARFTGEAIDALDIERCHLVVHDIAGPIGCEWAVRNPDRTLSLTALNTMLDVAVFRPTWSMWPFTVPVMGELFLRSTTRFSAAQLFYLQGVKDRSAVTREEVDAYYELLKREDGGRAFLRIMRGYEQTEEKQDLLWDGLAKRPYPAHVVWGENDPALGTKRRVAVQDALAVLDPTLLPARHFLQEEQAPAVAAAIAALATRAR